MKRWMLALACAALATVTFVQVRADEEKKAEVPTEISCAVGGGKVDIAKATEAGRYADHEYNRYYFCCDNCPKAFSKDPAKFAEKPSVKLASLPMPKKLACAVMPDHPVDVKEATEKKMFADHNGRRYYFCCAGCPPAFKKEPEKFAKNASVPVGQIELPKAVKCSVMPDHEVVVAEALSKKMFADYKGRRYLFCCEGCPAAFKNDPAKFAKNASIPSPKVEKKAEEAK